MSEIIGYARVSTADQTIENQRQELSLQYNITKWFADEAISGMVRAKDREGLSKLIEYAREGDSVIVAAIDRLGRNTVDVLDTVEKLQGKGVTVIAKREGFDLSTPTGKAMLTIMAALGELERENMKARQMAGINRARSEGKLLGRKKALNDEAIRQWRKTHNASIKATAEHFNCSTASVKRAMNT